MRTNDGGPAFPGEYVKHPPGEVGNMVAIIGQSSGMTLRDWFAGMALQGILGRVEPGQPLIDLASDAYELADFMLRARAEE